MADEWLFRVSIALDLFTFASIIILPLALYVLLKPVSRNLALLGLFWRLAEATVMFTIPLNGLLVLQLLSSAEYSTAFEASQLHALATLFLNAHDAAFEIGMILLGLGSIVFNYLLFKSNYIPRILAAWGIFSSLYLVVFTFAILLLPDYATTLRQLVYVPGFVGEVSLGLWLLLKGVKIPQKMTVLSNRFE